MPVSLVQVSKIAGVSKSTVSRVINHDPRVSQEAVRAVTEAIQQLGYTRPLRMGRPRRAPSGLTRGSIALIFPDPNPAALKTVLSGRLMHGIEETLRRSGLSLVIAGLPERDRLPQAIEQRLVDGVLLRGTAPESTLRAMIEGLGRLPCVVVFAARSSLPGNWDVVLEDNEAIAGLALEYLVSRGRSRLGFLNVMPEHPSFRQRNRAFIDRGADMNLPEGRPQIHSISQAIAIPTGGGPGPHQAAIEAALRQLFQDAGGPLDGLFVPGSDDAVVEVYRALGNLELPDGRKLVVGKDIDLISCNNDPTRLATLDPSLANIDIQAEAIGRAAAELLLWRLQNPKDPQRRLSVGPRLVLPDHASFTLPSEAAAQSAPLPASDAALAAPIST